MVVEAANALLVSLLEEGEEERVREWVIGLRGSPDEGFVDEVEGRIWGFARLLFR